MPTIPVGTLDYQKITGQHNRATRTVGLTGSNSRLVRGDGQVRVLQLQPISKRDSRGTNSHA